MQSAPQWCWHLDEMFVKINGETHYLWRAVDDEGEALVSFVTKRRDRKAALKFLKKAMKRYGQPRVMVTDKLRSYWASMKVIGNEARQETGMCLTTLRCSINRNVNTLGTGCYRRSHSNNSKLLNPRVSGKSGKSELLIF